MAELHLTLGIFVLSANLLAGLWGLVAWLTRRPSTIFWYLLRAAQLSIGVQVLLGAILLVTNHRASEDLHYLYGVLPLVIMLTTEMMRVGAAQLVVGDTDYEKLPEADARGLALQIFIAETRVMALGSLIIAALALRAGITSGGL
ncbi:MAG: hypothetical protein WAP35_00620 [Solirubrobacterales bacterium]